MVSIQRTSEVSTHSRPKAAGAEVLRSIGGVTVSTHSRPKAAGNGMTTREIGLPLFQHTAARRRLAKRKPKAVP